MSVPPLDRRKIGAAVGFVGNSMVVPVRDRLRKVPRKLHTAVESMAQRLAESRSVSFAEAVGRFMDPSECEAFDALPEAGKTEFEAAVLWRATLLYRLSCIRALEEFRPGIRGDSGWKGLLNRPFRLGPPLDYHGELPVFYNACTVNINATNLQMGKAVNQRVFDVPACGAFLLTDHQQSIEGLFDVGKEVVTYRHRGEIADLARFYLRDGHAREAVAKKGRERVLKEHTYRHRIDTLIRLVRKTYG
jgi:spore maturation protein CgeB